MSARPLTGRHVLALLLGFFAIVLLANVAFVWLALDSWTGLDTEQAYQKGLNYNRTIEAAAAQRRLGWRLDYSLAAADGDKELQVRLHDDKGLPLADRKITATLVRPTHAGHDLTLTLAATGPGRYQARFRPPLPGQWDLTIRVERTGGPPFLLEDRVELP